MACKQFIRAVIDCKLPSLVRRVRARSLAAALTLAAGMALSAITAAVHSAAALELEWATNAGSDTTSGGGYTIATDILDRGAGRPECGGCRHSPPPRGNSYVTGFFIGTSTFGAGEVNETVLIGEGQLPYVFVAKYDWNGQLLWAKRATDGASIGGIAVDTLGNSYLSGSFFTSATFGAGEANETVLEHFGEGSDIFVAKYAPDGAFLWVTSAGGSSRDHANGVTTDLRGNSYITGFFFGPSTFGAGEANETVLEGGGTFVAKYAPDGSLLWATGASGGTGFGFPLDPLGNSGVATSLISTAVAALARELPQNAISLSSASADGDDGSSGWGIATDPRGNSYVTGYFSGTITFGEGEANETVLDALGDVDVFVAKYAPDGALLWTTSAGGSSPDYSYGIATDHRGNSYVTGFFEGTATFGAGEANETVLEAMGDFDVLVAKYAPNGALLWARNPGGDEADGGFDIAADPRGNSYVTGNFDGPATFGEGEANETVLEGGGTFVAKYAPDGAVLEVTSASGATGLSIATNVRGNSYVTGGFDGPATFGEGEANETVLEGGGTFVAKYRNRSDQDQCPGSDRRATVVIDGIDTGVENAITDNGCTILDLIRQASEEAANRSEFLRAVALLTRTLLNDGLITTEEAGIIRTAASQATFPLS